MHWARSIFCACVAIVAVGQSAFSQDNVIELHDKPVAVLVNRVTEQDVVSYFRSLSEQLNVSSSTLSLYDVASQYTVKPQVERPIGGSLVYLTKGILPSVSLIRFHQLEDQAEYEKRIARQKAMSGNSGTIEGSNGKHRKKTVIQNRVAIPDASTTKDGSQADSPETEDSTLQSITISFGNSAGSTIQYHDLSDAEIVEENGKKFRQTTFTSEQYLRYHGQLMYTGDAKAVWDADLPTLDGILSGVRTDADLSADVYFDRVPEGLKTMGWSMLSAIFGTQMQQRDGESDYDYRVRNASGQLALGIAKAAIFDARRIKSMLRVAEGDRPLRGTLSIDVEEDSAMAKQLSDLSSANSRFAPIINDDAAVTLHMAVKLPTESKDVIRAGADWLQNYLIQEAGADAELVLGGLEVAESLGEIADHNNLEVFLKLGWTKESGSVIYGGLQVDDNPELLKSILTLLTPETATQTFVDRFAMTQQGELDMIEFFVPADLFEPDAPIRLTHAYVAHANSCLWFCFGGENCHRMLQSSVQKCQQAGMRIDTRVLTAELDVETWMSYPADDETGLAALPTVFDGALMLNFNARATSTGVPKRSVNSTKLDEPVSIQRINELGGRQTAMLHIDSSKAGFQANAEIGKALGNYFLVRWLQLLDSATSSIDLDELEQSIDQAKSAVE